MKPNAGRVRSRVLNIQRAGRSRSSANGALSLHSRGGARLRVRQTGQSLLVVSLGIFLATLPGSTCAATAPFIPIDLGTLGGITSTALAVNDRGQVVGHRLTSSFQRHAFSWTRTGGMIDLGTLGGSDSIAFDVNTRGEVIGWSSTAGDTTIHAFLWTQEAGMIDLGTLGGSFSVAQALNDSGQVVGYSSTTGEIAHAFSWTQTDGMIDLHRNPNDGRFSAALAVNASGQVVGYSYAPGDGMDYALCDRRRRP